MERTYMKRWAGVLLAIGLACAWPCAAGEIAAPEIGASAPTALGKDGKNKDVDLSAYRGKVVIVTFWASWCSYCLKELPALNDLQVAMGPGLLATIAVNVQDEPNAYRAMTRQMKDYQLVLSRDRNGDIAKTYGVRAYPNLWIIDPQGKVASHYLGYDESSLDSIIAEVKRLLTVELERSRKPGDTPAG